MGTPSAEAAVTVLRAQGLRMTPQRLAIVDEIMATHGHITPLVLTKRIQDKVPGVSASTVYRTLERLEDAGVLGQVRLETGIGYHRLGETRHAHLTCGHCGSERELSPDALTSLEQLIQRQHGFRPDLTHQVITGVCPACQQAPTEQATG